MIRPDFSQLRGVGNAVFIYAPSHATLVDSVEFAFVFRENKIKTVSYETRQKNTV